jgi:hypothetical protein
MADDAEEFPEDSDAAPLAAIAELQASMNMANLPILDLLTQVQQGIKDLRDLDASFTYHAVLVPDEAPPVYREAADFGGLLQIMAESVKEYRHIFAFRGRRLGVSRNGRWLVDGAERTLIPAAPQDDGDDVDPDGVLDLARGRTELIPVSDAFDESSDGDQGDELVDPLDGEDVDI